MTRPAAGSWRPCTTGSSPPTPRSTTCRRGVGGSARRPTCTSSGRRTRRSCGRCTGTRPAGATPPFRTSTCTPSAPPGTSPTPRQTLESAVQWCIEMGAEPQNARWRTVLAEVGGNPPAVPILVRGPVTAGGWPVTPGTPAARQDAGGRPEPTPLPHNQLPSDCAAPGEGWAAGPSRRDAQRPSGGRRSRRDSRRCGGGCCHQGNCSRRLLRRPQSAQSPQMVRETLRNGQHRPTGINGKCAGQPPISVTAHCAKPPLGRFCKAGVRGSIPLVSTRLTCGFTIAGAVRAEESQCSDRSSCQSSDTGDGVDALLPSGRSRHSRSARRSAAARSRRGQACRQTLTAETSRSATTSGTSTVSDTVPSSRPPAIEPATEPATIVRTKPACCRSTPKAWSRL